MELKLNTLKTKTNLIATGELSIFEVSQLKENLQKSLEPALPLTLDLKEVTQCDTACIQLILSTAKSAAEQNIDIKIKTSDFLKTLFERCGLETETL